MSGKNWLSKSGKTIRLRWDFCRSRISARFGKSAGFRPEPELEPKSGTALDILQVVLETQPSLQSLGRCSQKNTVTARNNKKTKQLSMKPTNVHKLRHAKLRPGSRPAIQPRFGLFYSYQGPNTWKQNVTSHMHQKILFGNRQLLYRRQEFCSKASTYMSLTVLFS